MSSFISNSSVRKMLLSAACFLIILIPHNLAVERNMLASNSIFVVDIERRDDGLKAAFDADLVILGSSRAKESVRPSILLGAAGTGEALNLAQHSGSSIRQSYEIVEALKSSSGKPPKFVLLTIEPWFFTNTVGLQPTRPGKMTAGELDAGQGIIAEIRSAQRLLLDTANKFCGSVLYSFIESAKPTERRPFYLWFTGISDTVREVAKLSDKPFFDTLSEEIAHNVYARRMRSYTKVVEYDAGFEGHVRVIRSKMFSLQEVFESQNVNYRTALKTYSLEYFDILVNTIKSLRELGSTVFMARLPVYQGLYQLENELAPAFNSHMARVAEATGVPYMDLNEHFEKFASAPTNFTDGSHMENSATVAFSNELRNILAPYISGAVRKPMPKQR